MVFNIFAVVLNVVPAKLSSNSNILRAMVRVRKRDKRVSDKRVHGGLGEKEKFQTLLEMLYTDDAGYTSRIALTLEKVMPVLRR